mgnify:FL=1
MRTEPDLEELRALVLAGREHSISAAATQLGVSQQALSLRIRNLEKELGVTVLARSPQGSHLTPAGELVVAWAEPLLDAADRYSEAVESLRIKRSASLQVAGSLTIAEHLLPDWIAKHRAALADTAPIVGLVAANSANVIRSVREGEVDLGFIETPEIPSSLSSLKVGHDTVEVVVQPGHPWAKAGKVTVEELASTPLVLREPGSGTRQALESALTQAGTTTFAEPAAVYTSTLAVRSAILAGLAPGALSSLAVAEDIRRGHLVVVPIVGMQITRPLTAIWAGKRPSKPARDFLEVVTKP